MNRKFFGTDGIRGKVGQHPITPDFMLKLGWAAGRVLMRHNGGRGKVLIGKDTRASGYMIESALEAGLSAAGMDIRLLGPMPTPAVAYLTRTFHAAGGIVISASHNPHEDNGIKFFSNIGTKLSDQIEHEIEAELDLPFTVVESENIGKVRRITNADGRYIEFCKRTVEAFMDFKDMNIVIDCANGATYHVAENVFVELGATVTAIGVSPNGVNINMQCGSTHPEFLRDKVIELKADLGIAFDGDGDRVVMVDHTGEILDGDELLYIIACSRVKANKLKGAVVGTQMSNLGLELALAEQGIQLDRSLVGDRYVMELLQQNECSIGGESSGHIICLDRTTTGDGIITALQVLAAMKDTNKSLNELIKPLVKFPQTLLNVKTNQINVLVGDHPSILEAVSTAEIRLGKTGRVLLRSSGTEPVIRVMVEGEDVHQVKMIATELAEVVEQTLSAA